mgnify:CR=1 FL=1
MPPPTIPTVSRDAAASSIAVFDLMFSLTERLDDVRLLGTRFGVRADFC